MAGAAAPGLAAAAGAQADTPTTPPIPAASARPPKPLIGIVNNNGQALVREGMSSYWSDEYNGALKVAVATATRATARWSG